MLNFIELQRSQQNGGLRIVNLGFLEIVGIFVILLKNFPNSKNKEKSESQCKKQCLKDKVQIAWFEFKVDKFFGLKFNFSNRGKGNESFVTIYMIKKYFSELLK